MSRNYLQDHLWFMGLALEQAEMAYKSQEVPVGAVVVSPTGDILSQTHNLKEGHFNPTAHAEMLAITESARKMHNWRLTDCTLYVTLEPCPMCLSAIVQARFKLCVFGAYDPKGGAISLGYRLHQDKRLNHQLAILGGVRHFECSKLLSQFFRERRSGYRPKN